MEMKSTRGFVVDGYMCPAPPEASKVTLEINRVTWKYTRGKKLKGRIRELF